LEKVIIEGNLFGDDIMKKKLIDEAPFSVIARKIRDCSPTIRMLEARNIMTKNYVQVSFFRPSVKKAVPNGNGNALAELMETIGMTHVTVKGLESLSLVNVQIDDRILNAVCLLI
jgi:hypothetical protein